MIPFTFHSIARDPRTFRPIWRALDAFLDDLDHSAHDRIVLDDETDTAYTVSLALPGFKRDQVAVEVLDGVLSVTAAKAGANPAHGDEAYARNRVSRSIALPSDVEAGKIEAKLEDGLLTLTLPKTPAAVPRKVAVS